MLGALGGALAGAAFGGSPIAVGIGSGIGSLLGGDDPKDAIKNALLFGGGSAVMPGVTRGIYESGIAQGLRGSAGQLFGVPAAAGGDAAARVMEPSAQLSFGAPAQAPAGMAPSQPLSFGAPAQAPAGMAPSQPLSFGAPAQGGGIGGLFGSGDGSGLFANMDPMQKMGLGLAVAGALEEPESLPPLETGDTLSEEEREQIIEEATEGLYVDPVTGERYDTEEERDAAIEQRRRLEENDAAKKFYMGGMIEGPGTETSDSIPAVIHQNGQPVEEALLSDGEFVMTGAAVRGAGNGDREKGAARMYELMRKFEQRAS